MRKNQRGFKAPLLTSSVLISIRKQKRAGGKGWRAYPGAVVAHSAGGCFSPKEAVWHTDLH